MKYFIALSIIGIAALTSCKKEGCTDPTALNYSNEAKKDNGSCTYAVPTPEPEPTEVVLGTATTSNNETVTLYAPSDLIVGYSYLSAEVKDDSGTIISGATLTFAPLMDMGMMQHSCPVIQPTFNATTNRYEGVSIFQMSSMAGTWEIDVIVNSNPANFTLNVAEAPTNTKPVGVYMGDDSVRYVVSFVRPEMWTTGSNDFDIYIHKMASMMSFPAVTDLDIVFTPEMVSMGHGSTGNVSPTHTGNGMYSGVVNLSMMGDWRFHLELSQNGTLVHSDAFLDILF